MPEIKINVGANEGYLRNSINGIASKTSATVKVKAQLDSASMRNFSSGLGKITGEVRQFQESMSAANARVIAFGASTAVLGGIILAFKELAVTTVQVEKSLIDINRVFNVTEGELSKFSDSLFNIAKNTASSFADVSKAALEFSRQGLNATDTLQRTQDAMNLVRLTGMDAGKAVSSLTAIVNGFNEAGLDSHSVLQKMVAVEQDYAVSAQDLAEALSVAGFAAQSAKVSFDEFNALVTIAKENTGRSASVIGEAFKTIFTRIQRSDTIENLERLHVTMRDVAGNTLPAVEILKNFSAAYSKAGDANKSFMGQQVAGLHQINILGSVVGDLSSNTGKYTEALNKGKNATNEADLATQRLNVSFSAMLSEAGTNLQQFASTLGSKEFNGVGKDLLNFFNNSILGPLNETLSKESEGTLGNTLGNGILKGLNNIISGPALTGFLVTFYGLAKNSLRYISEILPSLTGLTSETEKRNLIERSLLDVLNGQSKLSQDLYAAEGNRAAQAKLILDYSIEAAALEERKLVMARELAALAKDSGVVVSAKQGLRVAPSMIPHLANPIEDAMKREIMAGHNPSTVRVGYDPRLTESGGIGVYNTDEGSLSNAIDMHLQQGMSMTEVRNRSSSQNVPNFSGASDYHDSSALYGAVSQKNSNYELIARKAEAYAAALSDGTMTISEASSSIKALGAITGLSISAQGKLLKGVTDAAEQMVGPKNTLDKIKIAAQTLDSSLSESVNYGQQFKDLVGPTSAADPTNSTRKLGLVRGVGGYSDSDIDDSVTKSILKLKTAGIIHGFNYGAPNPQDSSLRVPLHLNPDNSSAAPRDPVLQLEQKAALDSTAQAQNLYGSGGRASRFAGSPSTAPIPGMGVMRSGPSQGFNFGAFSGFQRDADFERTRNGAYNDYLNNITEESFATNPLSNSRVPFSPYPNFKGADKSSLPSGFKAKTNPKFIDSGFGKKLSGFNKYLDSGNGSFATYLGVPMVSGIIEQTISGNENRTDQSYAQRYASSAARNFGQYAPTGAMLGGILSGPFPELAPFTAAIGLAIGTVAAFAVSVKDATLNANDFAKSFDESSKKDKEQLALLNEYVMAIKNRDSHIANGDDSSTIASANDRIQNARSKITDTDIAKVIESYSGKIDDLPKQVKTIKTRSDAENILQNIYGGKDTTPLKSAISFSGSGGELSDLIRSYGEASEQRKKMGPAVPFGSSYDEFGSFNDSEDALKRAGLTRKIEGIQSQITEKLLAGLGLDLSSEQKGEAAKRIPELLSKDKNRDLLAFIEKIRNNNPSKSDKASGENAASLTVQRDNIPLRMFDLLNEIDDQIRGVKDSGAIQKAIFDFGESISSSIYSPIEKIEEKMKQQSSEIADTYLETMLKIDQDFASKFEKVFTSDKMNVSAQFFKNKVTPALEAAAKGDISPINDIVQNNGGDKNNIINGKSIIELKSLLKEQTSKRADAKTQLDSSKNLLLVTEKLTKKLQLVDNAMTKISTSQSRQISDRKMETMRFKSASDLRIDELERTGNRPDTYFGASVEGKASIENSIQNKIVDERIAQRNRDTVGQVLPTYLEVNKDEILRLSHRALAEEQAGNFSGAQDLKSQAGVLKLKTINSPEDIGFAISDIKKFDIKDEVDLKKREAAVQSLKEAQASLNDQNEKDVEIKKRVAAENSRQAKNSTSFSYGLTEGFSDMNRQGDLLVGKLGKDLPAMFADGLSGAIMQAAKGAGNIGNALRDAAIGFGQEIMSSLLKASLYKGLGSLFGGIDFGSFLGGKQSGGLIKAQSGMYISGSRTGDKNPAMLEDGEYVLNREAVKRMGGPSALDNLNFDMAPRFASGGSFDMSLTPYTNEEQAIIQKHDHANRTIAKMMINGKQTNINYGDFSGRAFQTDGALGSIRQYALQQEQLRIQKNFQNAQRNAQLISSVVGAIGSISLSAGISGLTKTASLGAQAKLANPDVFDGMSDLQAGRAVVSVQGGGGTGFSTINSLSNNYSQMGFAAPTSGGSLFGYNGLYTINSLGNTVRAGGKQIGGRIGFNSGGYVNDGSRLSDTIPAALTGGEFVVSAQATARNGLPKLNRIENGTDSSASVVHHNNNSNNAFNISVNVNKNGAEVIGESGSSYEQKDIEMTKKLAAQIKFISQQTIRDEQRYRGIIQSNQR